MNSLTYIFANRLSHFVKNNVSLRMNFTKRTNTTFSIRKTRECNSPPPVRKLNKERKKKVLTRSIEGGKMHLEIPKTFLNGISERRNLRLCAPDSSVRVLRDTRRAQGTHRRRASWNTAARRAHLFPSFLAGPGPGDPLRERPTTGGGTRRKNELCPYPADGVITREGHASRSTVKTME